MLTVNTLPCVHRRIGLVVNKAIDLRQAIATCNCPKIIEAATITGYLDKEFAISSIMDICGTCTERKEKIT